MVISSYWHLSVSMAVSFAVTLFFLWALKPIAIRLELVDNPGGRKRHLGQIPLIGGIAMFLGFAFALLTLDISLAPYRGFIAACTLLIVVGVLDDLHELSARTRLYAQVGASFIMVFWSGVYLKSIGNVFATGNIAMGFLAIPFTVFSTVAAINAVNMVDGMDGVAGGLCLIEFCFISLFLFLSGHVHDIQLVGILISAVLAFLCLNFPWSKTKKARVFMGDSGSMLLGFTITWFLIKFSQSPYQSFHPVIILWILAVPVFDIITMTFRRLIRRQSPATATRDHIHHVLASTGLSHRACSLLIYLFALVMGSIGVLGSVYNVSDYVMLLLLFFSYGAYLVMYSNLLKQHTTTELFATDES